MSETLAWVEGVAKKYSRDLRSSIAHGAADLLTAFFGVHKPRDRLRRQEFWALHDISIELKAGEWMGLCGPNGAGKSTLLKLLNGILEPDVGRIEIRGRLGALIELGAGFHPLLTGRENVYVQGAIMGMSKKEVNEKFDEIVEFADIGDFLDAPVKFYSSGMHARLGFSVAIHFDPDVLVVDEVLAVGDIAFQERCMRRMEQLRERGKAVLMVQQHTYWIEALCDRAMWIEGGRTMMEGPAVDVVRAYLDKEDERIARSVLHDQPRDGSGETPVVLESVELVGEDGLVKDVFRVGERMTVRMRYTAHERVERPLFNVRIFNRGFGLLEASMLIDGPVVDAIEGRGVVECRLDPLPLTPKVYEVVVFARAKEGVSDIFPMRTYAVFRVSEEEQSAWPMRGPMAVNHLRQGSPVYVGRTWRFFDENGAPDERS